MTIASDIQEDLEILFEELGSTVVITPASSTVIDKWGDATITDGTPVSVTAIPYSAITSRSWESFGDLEDGMLDMVLSYDTTINVTDKVTFDSVDYLIIQVEKFPMNDTNLAFAIRIAKVL